MLFIAQFIGFLTDVKKCTSITIVCRKKVAVLCQIMLVHISTYPQMAAGFSLLDNVLTTQLGALSKSNMTQLYQKFCCNVLQQDTWYYSYLFTIHQNRSKSFLRKIIVHSTTTHDLPLKNFVKGKLLVKIIIYFCCIFIIIVRRCAFGQ